MSALTVGLVIALIAVLAAEFVNGWTDAPNAIATVISTGVMTPRQAVVMAVIMNTVGAMAGTAVATTVAQGIVAPSALTLPSITATMIVDRRLGLACGAPRHSGEQVARAAGRAGRCRLGRRRLGGTAMVGLAEGGHRLGLLARCRLWRSVRTRAADYRDCGQRTADARQTRL